MGHIYRRVEWHCTTATCERGRLRTTADREACKAAAHNIEERQSPIYWVKYTRAGKSYAESSGSERKKDATALLQKREGDIVDGKPVTPKIGKTTFEEAAADLLADYTTNRKKSIEEVTRRVEKHLTPFFAGWRMANITTADIRKYVAQRQANTEFVQKAYDMKLRDGSVKRIPEQRRPSKGASNGEINRELTAMKRMFTLALQAGKLLYRPHIPMLKENNVRTGFFESEQVASVVKHLPDDLQPVIEFAHITGWRIASEVLPLQWRQVDFAGGEVRLDAGTTKNGDGRVFPLTADLRTLLEAQFKRHEKLKKAGHIFPQVFWRMVAEGRGGDEKPRPIVSFGKAWKSACRAAGCPGRIPHDLRRTAVRNFVRNGIPERVAMQLTGHKTPSVFQRYNIVSDGDLKDAARRLDAVKGRTARQA
jgi:integrase